MGLGYSNDLFSALHRHSTEFYQILIFTIYFNDPIRILVFAVMAAITITLQKRIEKTERERDRGGESKRKNTYKKEM